MTEKAIKTKVEALPDLDDLLQCPVCYEIPAGQIFQCNEGHHVCGRCKLRLDVCPVCRAFFFGTRNYAMEELIANMRKLRSFKLGGKVNGNTTPEQQSEAKESTSEETESINNDEEDEHSTGSPNRTLVEPPRPCSGLFRCLCCKTNPERLPSARLLNHLRYFHFSDLIEGRSDENGEYVQAWQFSTNIGRIVTAVRVGDMGLFFLIIEIAQDYVASWLVMAASPRVAEEFTYTYTLSGNDREAIFSDVVWSVRTCEGFLKKRLRCLSVTGADARALLAPSTVSAKLRLRRTPLDVAPQQQQPRAVLRVANRSTRNENAPAPAEPQELEPFLQDLQNDVARLSRAFATLGREANALVRSEAEMRARLETHRPEPVAVAAPPPVEPPEVDEPELGLQLGMSRNARRRMRKRVRQILRERQPDEENAFVATYNNDQAPNIQNNYSRVQNVLAAASGRADNLAVGQNRNAVNEPRNQGREQREDTTRANNTAQSPIQALFSGFAVVMEQAPPVAPPPVQPPVPGAGATSNGTGGRNRKKRRQRR